MPRAAVALHRGPPPSAGPPPTETGTAKGDITLVELTRIQQVIARRMAESKATVPEFTLRSADALSFALLYWVRGLHKAEQSLDARSWQQTFARLHLDAFTSNMFSAARTFSCSLRLSPG